MFKKFQNVSNRIILLIIIICFLVAVSFSATINLILNNELSLAIETDLVDALEYEQMVITNYNTTNLHQMNIVANSIPNTYEDPVLIASLLKQYMPFMQISELYYVALDGAGIDANGVEKDFSDNATFNQVLETKKTASALSSFSTVENGAMDLAVPIISNGQLKGVLLGVNYVSNTLNDLNSNLRNYSYTIITNGAGEVLVSSSSDYIPLEVLGSEQTKFTDGYSFEKLIEDTTNGVSGTSKFTLNGVSQIIQYKPLGFSDLMIVIVAEEFEMQSGIRTVMNLLTQISVMVFLLISLLSVYVLAAKKSSVKAIEAVAYYDELTKLPNLSKLKKDMREILSKNKSEQYAIIKVDVNNFKSINEIYGFETGNKLLCAFKQITEIANEKSLITARVGIDEFIFFANKDFLQNLDNLTSYYEAFFKEIIPELKNHHLTFTYGRYYIEQDEKDVDDICSKVNLSHKMARNKEGSIIWDYDDNYKQQVLKAATLESKMKNALINDEFCAFLQPKFEIKTKQLIGAEALVRWIQQDGKMIFPDEFIPLFESNGFIVELDKFILQSVCKHLKQWKSEGHNYIPISVNFSRHHLENINFVRDVANIVDSFSIPHEFIEIEVTESTALQNELTFRRLIEELHKSDFKISIDDFGTGYSSLGLLKDFKMDVLKLDRSFINSTEESERRDLIVDGIVKLAHSLDMNIIAEGVEDQVQAEFLSSINCEAAQGYFYAKPMPVSEFEERYIKI